MTTASLRYLPGFDPIINALLSIFEDMMWQDPRCRYYIQCWNCGTCFPYDHPPTHSDVQAYEHEMQRGGPCPTDPAIETWMQVKTGATFSSKE